MHSTLGPSVHRLWVLAGNNHILTAFGRRSLKYEEVVLGGWVLLARISRHHHFNLSTYGVAHAVLVAVDFPASEPDASTQAVGRYVVAEGDG